MHPRLGCRVNEDPWWSGCCFPVNLQCVGHVKLSRQPRKPFLNKQPYVARLKRNKIYGAGYKGRSSITDKTEALQTGVTERVSR